MSRGKKRFLLLFCFALLIFVLDFVSKRLTHLYLPLISHGYTEYPYGGIGVFENFLGIEFSISHATNKGAAWGLFANISEYLIVARVVLIVAVSIYAFFNKVRALDVPLALIIVGAVGNVVDYFLYGHVVDMLNFKFWGYSFPVFNIADSAITIGVALLFFLIIFGKKNEGRDSSNRR